MTEIIRIRISPVNISGAESANWMDVDIPYLVLMTNDVVSVFTYVVKHSEMERHDKSQLVRVIQDMLWQIGLFKYTRQGSLTLSVAGFRAWQLLGGGVNIVELVKSMLFTERQKRIVRFVRKNKYDISFTPSDLAAAFLVQANEMKLRDHYTHESCVRYEIYNEAVRITAKNSERNEVLLRVDALYHAHRKMGRMGLLR